MNGKQAKKLRRFAKAVSTINPTKDIDVVYNQLKTIHNKKTNPEKYATYKKVSEANSSTKAN